MAIREKNKEENMSKKRLQFDFSDEAVKRLDEIVERIHASTRAEVVRRALKLYDWVTWELNHKEASIALDKNGKLFYFKDI